MNERRVYRASCGVPISEVVRNLSFWLVFSPHISWAVSPASQPHAPLVLLRSVERSDLPALFAFESDPAWCAMAMVKPRTQAAFNEVWEKILADWAAGLTNVVQKAILADGELCGTIGCRLLEDRWNVGYGLAQSHWGRGITSRALGLLLAEVPFRPLYATAAAANAASVRVLLKHGFVITERRTAPETQRGLARDEVSLILA